MAFAKTSGTAATESWSAFAEARSGFLWDVRRRCAGIHLCLGGFACQRTVLCSPLRKIECAVPWLVAPATHGSLVRVGARRSTFLADDRRLVAHFAVRGAARYLPRASLALALCAHYTHGRRVCPRTSALPECDRKGRFPPTMISWRKWPAGSGSRGAVLGAWWRSKTPRAFPQPSPGARRPMPPPIRTPTPAPSRSCTTPC